MREMRRLIWTLGVSLAVATAAIPAAAEQPFAAFSARGSNLSWSLSLSSYDSVTLTVTGPEEFSHRAEFGSSAQPALSLFDAQGAFLPDGQYTWELSVNPAVSAHVRRELSEARGQGDGSAQELRQAGLIPSEPLVQNGYFTVVGGSVLQADGQEETAVATSAPPPGQLYEANEDQVILDDLIVDGSICAGLDCVNGESFGFDTLRLKENNLRIKFQDTSNSASFPTNDWQITANDSTNGGANKFSIDDIDGGRTPFTIEAGSPSHSLYVDSSSNVGFGTSTPVVELHVKDGDTPTLRLEQDGSSGFTAQTWDVAANETNFFVRDATNGSRLPFRIRPSAPSNSIFVNTNGDVGFNTASPTASLHAIRSDGTAKLRIEETNSGAPDGRVMAEFVNNGAVFVRYQDTSGADWVTSGAAAGFTINELADAADVEFLLNPAGQLFVNGVEVTSDRNAKSGIRPVDLEDVLERVENLPISTWSFKDEEGTRHMGPMAQDFAAAFGLGSDERRISPVDMAGVSLAAVQALSQRLRERDTELETLRARNAELSQRMAALEVLVASMADEKGTRRADRGSRTDSAALTEPDD